MKIDKTKLMKMFTDLLEMAIGDSENEKEVVEAESTTPAGIPVVKSRDSYEKRAMFIVLEPQNDDGTTIDAHGDWYGAEDVEKACHNYNRACRKAGLMHSVVLEDEDVWIQESYITPTEFVTESGEKIKKGTWVQWWKFESDELWQDVLDGKYDSVSIDCWAEGEEL